MARSYKAEDGDPMLQWNIDQFNEQTDPDLPRFGQMIPGYVVEVKEMGDVLSIKPIYSDETRITKEDAVVLAEDILARHAAEVGPIAREP